jgi:hypothetical protein
MSEVKEKDSSGTSALDYGYEGVQSSFGLILKQANIIAKCCRKRLCVNLQLSDINKSVKSSKITILHPIEVGARALRL